MKTRWSQCSIIGHRVTRNQSKSSPEKDSKLAIETSRSTWEERQWYFIISWHITVFCFFSECSSYLFFVLCWSLLLNREVQSLLFVTEGVYTGRSPGMLIYYGNRTERSPIRSVIIWLMDNCRQNSGREIAPNTGANATKFFTLATKSWKLVAKLATTTFHYNLTKRYSELNKFAKINPRQTSSLSLFPKRSTCISIDN